MDSWLDSNLFSTKIFQNRTIFDRFRNFDFSWTLLICISHLFHISLEKFGTKLTYFSCSFSFLALGLRLVLGLGLGLGLGLDLGTWALTRTFPLFHSETETEMISFKQCSKTLNFKLLVFLSCRKRPSPQFFFCFLITKNILNPKKEVGGKNKLIMLFFLY